MTTEYNETDINSKVSIEAITTPEDIVEFPLVKKVVEKKQKKKTDKKVERKVEKNENRDDFLKDINKVTYLEKKRMDELEIGKSYLIENMERITTKYGDSIIAILDDEGDRFNVFLPKRYPTKFSNKHIAYMNENTFSLKYLGGKYNEIEFH
jgi:hypothetical protein